MKTAALFLLALVSCCGAMFAPAAAWADESRPVYVEITQLSDSAYRLDWKIPPVLPTQALPEVALPADCVHAGEGSAQLGGFSGSAIYTCSSPLSGRDVSITYPLFNPALSAMIRLKALNGEERIGVLPPQELSWHIPEAETRFGVALQYTRLGIAHIWSGVDHLLFLTCLLWIAGGLRRILITITGFTAAHSVTLIMSALDIIHLPPPPVEAAIALSIVFLAREIAVNRRDSLTWRYPVAVSSSFGLLHGFGFASALTQVGLPQTALLTGLLCFNLGVEIGQILFVAAIGLPFVAVTFAARQWRKWDLVLRDGSVAGARLQQLGAYGVGIVSTYWLVARVADFAASPQ